MPKAKNLGNFDIWSKQKFGQLSENFENVLFWLMYLLMY